MGNIKFSDDEKIDLEILRCLLKLYEPWQNEMNNLDNGRKEVLKEGIIIIQNIIEDSDLTNEEINIIKDSLINKVDTMEKVGRKYFYSDSGLRNKVNLILKKMLERIKI